MLKSSGLLANTQLICIIIIDGHCYFQFPEHLGFTIKTNKMGHFQINSFESLIIFVLGKCEVPCQVILQFKTLTIFLCSTECSM